MSSDADGRAGRPDTAGVARFGVRTVLGGTAVLLGAVPFLLLWLLVQRSWAPLAALDGEVATELNQEVRESALLVSVLRVVTDLGGTGTAVLLLTLTVVGFFVEARTPERTAVVTAIGELSGTRAVLAIGTTMAVLGLALTATWQPVTFVIATLAGEVLVYAVTAQLVGRMRPAVPDLTSGLPVGASWPSGHATAAAALYGAAAALVLAYGRGPRRALVLLLPVVLAPAIGISRVYVAAHHPTDVLAGLVIGGVWVTACARLLLPAPGRGVLAVRIRERPADPRP